MMAIWKADQEIGLQPSSLYRDEGFSFGKGKGKGERGKVGAALKSA